MWRKRDTVSWESNIKTRNQGFSTTFLNTPPPVPTSKCYPKIMCSNARSVVMKMDELRSTLFLKKIDLFVCTETWLSEEHDDDFVNISNYNCFRNDRRQRIGGGVAVWIRNDFPIHLPQVIIPDCIECVALCIKSSRIILLAMYIPPIAARRHYQIINSFITTTLDQLLIEFPDYDIIVCGDLNKFDVNDVCISFNLVNKYNKPTYGKSELDYILLGGDICDFYNVTDCCPIDKSKTPHLSLLAIPSSKSRISKGIIREVYDLRASNINAFASKMQSINWGFIHDNSVSLNDKCIEFQNIIIQVARESIPLTYVTCTDRDKPWITPLVKSLINQRWAAYRKRNFSLYNHLKHKVHEEISKAKVMWTRRLQNTSKDMWKAVNTHRGIKSSNPITTLMSEFKNPEEAVEAMNLALTSAFLPNDSGLHIIDQSQPSAKIPWVIDVTPELVCKLIEKIPDHKASPDIPTILYKYISFIIAEPLCELIQMSIKEGIVPEVWKHSFICPLPKSSPPDINNLRPISILSIPEKILETVVLKSVKERFVQNYDECQFGYRPGSSTQCAIVALHDNLTRNLDNTNTCGSVIISYDYTKAFDRLRFDLIIHRLLECRFPCQFVLWISSYLSDRKQSVRIGVHTSNAINVTSGVPQGSILGPYLYAITTATYKKLTDLSYMIKYADDTSICFPIFPNSDNTHIINEHEHLLSWSHSMSLEMNETKCKRLLVKKKNFNVDININNTIAAKSVKILGVWFNEEGNWSTHVEMTTKAASKRLFALRTLKSCISWSNLRLTYFMLVRSIMEYCSAVFIGMSTNDKSRFHALQRRFHRILCGSDCRDECLPDLDDRRLALSIRFLRQIMNQDHILHNYLPPVSSSGRFLLPQRSTSRRSNSFFLTICDKYNHSHFTR